MQALAIDGHALTAVLELSLLYIEPPTPIFNLHAPGAASVAQTYGGVTLRWSALQANCRRCDFSLPCEVRFDGGSVARLPRTGQATNLYGNL